MKLRAASFSLRWLAGWAVSGIFASAASAAPFIAGADVSSLPVHEDHGAVYRADGVTGDAVDILSNSGTNYFRLRLFVNPHMTNNYNGGADPFVAQDLNYTIALAQRVKQAGGKLLLDFMYSDTWADPGHQWKPAAWQSIASMDELKQQVYDYTKSSIEAFKAANVMPDMVQIGNEIAAGTLWNGNPGDNPAEVAAGENSGYLWTGGSNSAGFDRLATLLSAGIQGARDGADPGEVPLVMIHHDQGSRWNSTSYYFDNLLPRLEANGTDFDVIGYSYYPIYHPGGLTAVAQNLNNTVDRYGKPVIIAETGFPSRNPQSDEQNLGFPVTADGQRQFLQALVDTVQSVPNGMGMGVFWWYAEARPTSGLNVFEGGRYGLFDQNGNLLPAASVFEQFLPTPGDFNRDGVVDAADYTIWRDGLGTTYDENDYADWKAHFGMTGGSGSAAASIGQSSVPEPAALAMIMFGLLLCCGSSRAIR